MSLLWLRVAVLLYGIAALAVLPAALYDRPRWRRVAIPATVAAVLFHFVSLAEMLNAAHHRLPGRHPRDPIPPRPPSRLRLPRRLLALQDRLPRHLRPPHLLPPRPRPRPPPRPGEHDSPFLLHSGWIFLHIALLLAAYAALFLSLLASLLYLIQERRLKQKPPPSPGFRRSKPPTRSPSRPSSSASPA